MNRRDQVAESAVTSLLTRAGAEPHIRLALGSARNNSETTPTTPAAAIEVERDREAGTTGLRGEE